MSEIPDHPDRSRRRWLALCLSLASAFLALELGVRVVLASSSDEKRGKYARPGELALERRKYLPHPYLCYALNPGYRSADGRNRHDALGFRGPELALPKPPGTYRIVCLGGSTVYDTEIEDWHQAFPAQLEEVLHERGFTTVEVVNGGVGGYTSFEVLVDVNLRVLEVEPDLLLVYHSSNDVHARLVPASAFRADNSGYRHAWDERSPWWDRSMLLRWLGVQWGFSPRNTLEELTKVPYPERDQAPDLAANSPRWLVRNTRALVALAHARGVAVMLSSFASCPERGGYPASAAYQRGIAENDAALAELARELALPYYDFAAEMPRELELWDDGVHNTPAGARRKAVLFARFVALRFLPALDAR